MIFKDYILNILSERQSDVDFNSLSNKYFDIFVNDYIDELNSKVETLNDRQPLHHSDQLVTGSLPTEVNQLLRESKIDWNKINKEIYTFSNKLSSAYSSSAYMVWIKIEEISKSCSFTILGENPKDPDIHGTFNSPPFTIKLYDRETYNFYIKPLVAKFNEWNLLNILIETYKQKMIEDDVLSVYNTLVIPEIKDQITRTISMLRDSIIKRLKYYFIHEFRHFYDQVKYKGLHRDKFDQERYDAGDTSTNQEYNAYYTTLADIVVKYKDLVKDSSDPIYNLTYSNYQDETGTDTETFRNTLKRIKEDSEIKYRKVLGRLSTLISKIKTEK